MIINFDSLNRARTQSLILCNPNGQELFSMPLAKDIDIDISLNSLSSLSFEIDKVEDCLYYDYIITRRHILLQNVGKFIITNVEEEIEGDVRSKKVKCEGLEWTLASKNMGLLEGTYKFYDPSSSDKSIMNIILSYLPSWSIGDIEASLWNIYRTFDIKDNNIYNFMMTEVQEAYECIFIFDSFKRTISAKTAKSVKKETDIFLSDRNIVKSLSIEEDAEDIKTALDIYGDGDLTIYSVNPMGTPTIYDFSYYKSVPDLMSQNLIDAITVWEKKWESKKAESDALMIQIKTINNNLIKLETSLKELNSSLKVLEEEEAMKIVAGDNKGLQDVHSRMAIVEQNIENKKVEIESEKNKLKEKQETKRQIAVDLKLQTNFTTAQYEELSEYIIQSTHQCTNFATTDSMTDVEKQDVAQELYEYGELQLKRVSQPLYTFDIDVVDFLKLIDYKYTIEQLELGCEITICLDREKDVYAYVLLIGYSTTLDDFGKLKLKFSNRLKFTASDYTWQELINKSNTISTSVNFESPSWNKGEQANSKIDDYINNALDLTKQQIVNASNQEFVMNAQGIHGKQWIEESGMYSPEQIRILQNVIAFSSDSFNTVRTAVGKILAPDGTTQFGINTELLVGQVTLTKKLVIENENHTFKVDGDSILIKNANIIMTNDKGQDKTLSEALNEAGNNVYYQGTTPISPVENDIWYNTSKGNECKVYKSGSWKDVKDTDINIAISTANTVANKVNGVIDAQGNINADKMVGSILAGKSNIICATTNASGNVLALNENGIIVTARNADGSLSTETMTCITKDGIVAEAIKGGTISGVTLIGGNTNAVHTVISPSAPLCVKDGGTKIIELWAESNESYGRYKYLRFYDNSGNEELAITTLGSPRISTSQKLGIQASKNIDMSSSGYITIEAYEGIQLKNKERYNSSLLSYTTSARNFGIGNHDTYLWMVGSDIDIDGVTRSLQSSEQELKTIELEYENTVLRDRIDELELTLIEKGVI